MPNKHNPSGARFERNHDQAQRSAKAQLEVIGANIHLLAGPKTSAYVGIVVNFQDMANRGEHFTPYQLSFIDHLYEKCMKNAGLPSVNVHVDRKKRGLRYG